MKTLVWAGLLILFAPGVMLDASDESSVFNFMAERRAAYLQTGVDTVSLNPYDSYQGCVGLEESGPTSFFSAVQVILPDSSTVDLQMESNEDDLGWWYYSNYTSLDALNTDYPPGDYSIVATKTAGGTTTVDFTIESLDFPPAPVVSNYTDLLAIDPDTDTIVTWNAWTGGTENDIVVILVNAWNDDLVFSNRDEILSGANYTTGMDTTYSIPAGTFERGGTYTLSVEFIKTYGLELTGGVPDFPGAMKAATAEAETTCGIRVVGRRSPFQPTGHVGGKWDNMWGWIDDTYFPWVYSYGLDIWIYVYDGDTVDMSKGYWVCYLLPDGSDFGWGFAYANGGWWCITSDLVTHWLTPQDPLPGVPR